MDKVDIVNELILRYDVGFQLAVHTVDALFSKEGGTLDVWPKDRVHLHQLLDEWEETGKDLST